MFVHHSVKDFTKWRKAYDAFNAERRRMGVTGQAVYQSLDDRNEVTVSHDFKTRRRAEIFAGSDRLKEVMKDAGVKGKPQIWFVKESKKPKKAAKAKSPAKPKKPTKRKKPARRKS
jgi:hypothetical protein